MNSLHNSLYFLLTKPCEFWPGKPAIWLATEVIPWRNAKLLTILSIVPNTSSNSSRVTTITFDSIDSSNAGPEPLAIDDNRVDIVHPKPEGCPECSHGIVGNCFWCIQTIKSNASTSWYVVIIPCDLKRPPSVVLLTWVAWKCCTWLTIGWLCNLLYVAKMSSFMGDMGKECSNFTPNDIGGSTTKLGIKSESTQKSSPGVESLTSTASASLVNDPIKERIGHQTRHGTTTTRRWSTRTFSAPLAAVGVCGATETKSATT